MHVPHVPPPPQFRRGLAFGPYSSMLVSNIISLSFFPPQAERVCISRDPSGSKTELTNAKSIDGGSSVEVVSSDSKASVTEPTALIFPPGNVALLLGSGRIILLAVSLVLQLKLEEEEGSDVRETNAEEEELIKLRVLILIKV